MPGASLACSGDRKTFPACARVLLPKPNFGADLRRLVGCSPNMDLVYRAAMAVLMLPGARACLSGLAEGKNRPSQQRFRNDCVRAPRATIAVSRSERGDKGSCPGSCAATGIVWERVADPEVAAAAVNALPPQHPLFRGETSATWDD